MDEYKTDIVNDILIVKVDILIATHRDAQPLWNHFENYLLFNHKKIIIDLSLCNTVDSPFIGMIIKIFRKVKEKEGLVKLVYPVVKSTEVFTLTGIPKIIDCYETLEQALKSFK
jgi:anti-anti-sigma regulatory factor